MGKGDGNGDGDGETAGDGEGDGHKGSFGEGAGVGAGGRVGGAESTVRFRKEDKLTCFTLPKIELSRPRLVAGTDPIII